MHRARRGLLTCLAFQVYPSAIVQLRASLIFSVVGTNLQEEKKGLTAAMYYSVEPITIGRLRNSVPRPRYGVARTEILNCPFFQRAFLYVNNVGIVVYWPYQPGPSLPTLAKIILLGLAASIDESVYDEVMLA